MILSGQTIRNRVIGDQQPNYKLVIDPFNERTIHNGMSYGLSVAGYDIRICTEWGGPLQMWPGAFKLATVMEKFAFPYDVMGKLADKSTWARRGIALQNTIFEPGWIGYPTIEISNHGQELVNIYDGDPIGQMIFHKLDVPASCPYNGKYQGQEQIPTPAKEE